MLSKRPGTCQSSGGYSVVSHRVYFTMLKSWSPRSSRTRVALRRLLYRGYHLFQILLKVLEGHTKKIFLFTLREKNYDHFVSKNCSHWENHNSLKICLTHQQGQRQVLTALYTRVLTFVYMFHWIIIRTCMHNLSLFC